MTQFVSPYIGEVVHLHWRGKCVPAQIVAFWEDKDTARITFTDTSVILFNRRCERGQAGEDKRWHTLADCPHIEQQGVSTEVKPQQTEKVDGRTKEGRRLRGLSGQDGAGQEQEVAEAQAT